MSRAKSAGTRSRKQVEVKDLQKGVAPSDDPKGGGPVIDCEGYASLTDELLSDVSVRTVSPTTTTSLKANKN